MNKWRYKNSNKKPTVIDFFCGAGGFSEGFRQLGFEIILGVDHWQSAIDTFNYNFDKDFKTKNVLDYADSIEEIEKLPDTDVIIGSPPCVSFSNSNKSGKADKSLGVKLTETFLRIVALKKHKKNSKLKAWYMENVVNSRRYLQPSYTFHDLKLSEWAKKNRLSPNKIAIQLFDNSTIINSADYGSIQIRKRIISGEILKYNKLIIPSPKYQDIGIVGNLPLYRNIGLIRKSIPSPYEAFSVGLVEDPLYNFKIGRELITDHFYDTGIYQCDWENSEYLKVNHPYMGKMSFPENPNRPGRTITATKIVNSRESIIYKAEVDRKGDGEYRTPTVREAAIIMGFPITYQFIGQESTKWRLIGNAVCPSVSNVFAKELLTALDLKSPSNPIIKDSIDISTVPNLNTYQLKTFDKVPMKNKGARFRRHPIKEGNMTVALSNYDVIKNGKRAGKWRVFVFYGTGEGFGVSKYEEYYYEKLEDYIKTFKEGDEFIKIINNGFSEKIAKAKQLQKMYETRRATEKYLEPTQLIKEVALIVNRFGKKGEQFEQEDLKIFKKDSVPKRQLYALYAINKIVTIANSN